MEINWKVIAIFGGIGFFLSFLVGIISGVRFGTILLRGLAIGVVFGGIGFGLTFVIKKYLPGLLSDEAAETEEEIPGVDIVIEEELPRQQVEDANVESADESEESEDAESTFVEEVEESSTESTEFAETETVETENTERKQESAKAEEVEELPTMEEDENIDALPDIGEFSGSFSTGGEYEEGEEEGGDTGQFSGSSSAPVEILGQEEDPAVVAKAVQTMLKKE